MCFSLGNRQVNYSYKYGTFTSTFFENRGFFFSITFFFQIVTSYLLVLINFLLSLRQVLQFIHREILKICVTFTFEAK